MSRREKRRSPDELGQIAYDRTRDRLVEEYERLITAQERVIAGLADEPRRIIDAIVSERKRQGRREERLRKAERALLGDQCEANGVRVNEERRRVELGAAKLAELYERKAAIPKLEGREAAARVTLASLQERLTDNGNLHEVASEARERAERQAVEDREAATDAKRRDAARKVNGPRDKPPAEQIARRGIAGTTREGAFRLKADLPETILRMSRAGFRFETRELEAAARYREDYLFGCERSKLVGTYDVGVQGGAGFQDVKESKLDAFERYRKARAAVPVRAIEVLEAVLLHDCELGRAPGLANRYRGDKSKRTANGVLLALALEVLAAHYSRL